MRKNRFLPFGYTMNQGELIPHPKEAPVVKNIFTLYLNGNESYASLARTLSKGSVPYHKHTKLWNKNMIKRILENTSYLGDDDYPSLINEQTFRAVRTLISSRAPRNIGAYKRTYKTEYVCGVCAKDLEKEKIRENILVCNNPSCSQYNVTHSLASIGKLLENTEDLSQRITQLTIERKTELQRSSPSEEVLLHIAEELAELSIKEAISTKEEVTVPTLASSLEESFSPYKRVILFPGRIQIL